MANTTESKRTVSRKEFATYLRNLADEFESEGEARISVGNKSVSVHPAENVECGITVTERSAILRGDKEALDLEATWKKGKGGGGGEDRDEVASEDRDEVASEDRDERTGEDSNGSEAEPETEDRSGGD